MGNAAVAVCLISPDYLASDFVMKEEIPYLLKRRADDGIGRAQKEKVATALNRQKRNWPFFREKMLDLVNARP